MDGNYLLVDAEGNATEVDGEIKIGRGKEVNIVLKDKLVSRHHATVWMEGDSLMLRDEESVNGTFVNDKQIYDPVELNSEDKIKFGDEVLTVRAPLGEEATVRDIRLPAEMETKVEMLPPEMEETPKEVDYSSDFDEPGDVYEYESDGEDMGEAAEGGGSNKKLLLIGLIVLLVLCCCVVVAGAGFWFITSSSTTYYDMIESGRLFMALL